MWEGGCCVAGELWWFAGWGWGIREGKGQSWVLHLHGALGAEDPNPGDALVPAAGPGLGSFPISLLSGSAAVGCLGAGYCRSAISVNTWLFQRGKMGFYTTPLNYYLLLVSSETPELITLAG